MPHARLLTPLLLKRLRARRVITLTGARQTGKTTLVRDLLPASARLDLRYRTLDDPDERLALSRNPVALLEAPRDALVVLDEVQKMPSLMDAVKLLADRPDGPRLLLLGSAHLLLMKQVRETLAGRASLLELWPLALAERTAGAEQPAESLLDRLWRDGPEALEALARTGMPGPATRALRTAADEALRWGGYPALEPLPDDAERRAWLADYRATYLERDLSDLGRVADLDQFALGQKLLASRTASLLSAAAVSRDLGVTIPTVQRYLRFLEISYQAFLLRPFHGNATKRLVKHPKLYWTDVGMARLLSERQGLEDGAIYETHVLNELLRWRAACDPPPDLFFYRTHGGLEADFLIKGLKRTLWIEAKAARRVGAPDATALRQVMDDLALPGELGLVAYRGEEVAPLAKGVWAVPDAWLFGATAPAPAR